MGYHKCVIELQISLLVCAACICECLESLSGVIAKFCNVKAELVELVEQVSEEMVEKGWAIAF
eukprot:10150849-Ditylum_brightwellii.AAC.1